MTKQLLPFKISQFNLSNLETSTGRKTTRYGIQEDIIFGITKDRAELAVNRTRQFHPFNFSIHLELFHYSSVISSGFFPRNSLDTPASLSCLHSVPLP